MKISLLSALLLLSINIFSQITGEIYKVDSPFKANKFFDGICQRDSIKIVCENATLRIIDADEDIVKIKIIETKQCENHASAAGIYCVKQEVFSASGSVHLIPADKKWNVFLGGGVLTVPFKFDIKTFKVFPAGEIGGVGGFKLNHTPSGVNLILGLILGLSSIPLNDLNSNVANEIKTVSGITGGGGISINIVNGFQFGFYYGRDFYNAENTKFKKDWLSFGFGYDFVRLIEDKKKEKKSMISAPF